MITAWDGFFSAQVGASAALTGLVFVGVSLNMSKILASPILPNRSLQALLVLFSILVVSSLGLVPAQSVAVLGAEVLVVGVVSWAMNAVLDVRNFRKVEPAYRRSYRANMVLGQIALLLYAAGGLYMIAGGDAGLYLVAAAVILCFLKGVSDAWVLLVEINR